MSEASPTTPKVFIVASNAEHLAVLRLTREMLDSFEVTWTERILDAAGARALDAESAGALVVASSDGVLPAALAAATDLPVVRVPTADAGRTGLALLCDPATADLLAGEGASFATVAIGEAGAKNAALFVVSMLGLTDASLWQRWLAFRQRQTDAVLALPPLSPS